MNVSGPPIAKALRETVVDPSSMAVIHDSLDHRPMAISPTFGGSHRGHNGVRSIISALGNNKGFHRLRIGIGRGEGDVADYVLGRLSSVEKNAYGPDGTFVDTIEKHLADIVKAR